MQKYNSQVFKPIEVKLKNIETFREKLYFAGLTTGFLF